MLTYNQMIETGKPFKNVDSPENKVWVEFDGEFISGQELSQDEISRMESSQKQIDYQVRFKAIQNEFGFENFLVFGTNVTNEDDAELIGLVSGNVNVLARSILVLFERHPELAIELAKEIDMSSEGILNENLN